MQTEIETEETTETITLSIEEQLLADERRQQDEDRRFKREMDAKLAEIKGEYRQLIHAENPSLSRVKEVTAILGVDGAGFIADREAWKRSQDLPRQLPNDGAIADAVAAAQAAFRRWEDRGLEIQALTDLIHNAHRKATDEVQRLTELKKSLQKQLADDQQNHHRIFD